MFVEFFPCDERFRSPVGGVAAGEEFTVCVTTEEGAQTAFTWLTKDGEKPVCYPMRLTAEVSGKKTFVLKMFVTTPGLYFYHFEFGLHNRRVAVYADRDLLPVEANGDEWQLTAYEKLYQTPDCTDGGIFYQIMPDRFNIGKVGYRTKNGSVYRDDWGGTPSYKPDGKGIIQNRDMFGGNLDGIIEKLDYLKSLSVKVIYLNPIFEAASNHKYDTGNYRRVDGDFGGNEALDRLIEAANKKDIKIMLDGVFSHTGDDSIYFNRYGHYDSVGAYQSENSPYRDWYDFKSFPDDYTCWWGVKILPCVNEHNHVYEEFINGEEGVIRSYMRKGIVGWRLDVADELPDSFLKRLTRAAKKVNPKAMVLGEVWEDASNKISYSVRRKYFNGEELDSATNYPIKNAVIDFVKFGDALNLKRTLNSLINNYPKHILDKMMNLLGTHDTPRILTELSSDAVPALKDERADYKMSDRESAKKRLKIAAVLQYTLPGVPCVYYGDEAGMEGFEDPFNRRGYPWGNEDGELIEFYRALGKLRKLNALKDGSVTEVSADGKAFSFIRGALLKVVANAGERSLPLNRTVTDMVTGEKLSEVPPCRAVVFKLKPR